MAALDFPASPTDGQVYNNWVYSTSKGAWKAKPLTPGQAQPSATPPANPSNGDQWYNTIDGVLYIYYNDGNSSQWVESRSAITSDGYTSPNYLINGAFDFWQRGTSFSSAGYTADRFGIVAASGQTPSASQQAFTPGTAPVAGYEGQYFARVAWSGTPSGTFWFNQKVEDVRTLAGQTVTLSFWAKASSATTALSMNIEQNFGSGGSTVNGITGSAISLTTSWQRFSQTFTIPSVAGKTIGTSSYLDVRPLYGGSSVAGNSIDIWGVQLEQGPVATPFRRNANSLQGELAACHRYYYRVNSPLTSYVMMAQGTMTGNTTQGFVVMHHPVEMRANPYAVEYNADIGVTDGSNYRQTGTAVAPTISPYYVSKRATTLNVTVLTTNQYVPIFLSTIATTGYVALNAEL